MGSKLEMKKKISHGAPWDDSTPEQHGCHRPMWPALVIVLVFVPGWPSWHGVVLQVHLFTVCDLQTLLKASDFLSLCTVLPGKLENQKLTFLVSMRNDEAGG